MISISGVQLWSSDGSSLLCFMDLASMMVSEYTDSDSSHLRCKCITADGENIFVGDSMGGITCIVEKQSAFSASSHLHTPSSSSTAESIGITCIHASEGILVSGNEQGEVLCYRNCPPYELLCRFQSGGFITTSICCTRGIVLAAYSCGHLRIFRISLEPSGVCELAVELAAHSRCINAVVLHPANNIFATCSDDSMMHVWELPSIVPKTKSDMRLIFTENISNRLLTGISFFHDGKLGVLAYDDGNMHLFEPAL